MIKTAAAVGHPCARVRLIRATPEDAERTYLAIAPESAQNLSFFTSAYSLARQRAYLEKMSRSETDVLFIIERAKNGAAVGAAGLHEYDASNRSARLGVLVFDPDDRGLGYGREATRLILDCAFTSLRLHKIYVRLLKGNEKALKKYLGMGFVVESAFREEYLLNGTYRDMTGLSLLDREWLEKEPVRGITTSF